MRQRLALSFSSPSDDSSPESPPHEILIGFENTSKPVNGDVGDANGLLDGIGFGAPFRCETPQDFSHKLLVRLDAILQGWILSTITDEVSDLVISSVSTTSALWKVIHDLFHDNKHARAMQLEHQFRTTVKGSTPMATYCQELKNIADWLDDVDAPVSEHQLVLQMLRGLPDDLQAQTSFLQFQDPMPSFLQVRSALLLLDRQRTPLGSTSSTALLAGHGGSSHAGGQHGGTGGRGSSNGGNSGGGGQFFGSNYGDGSSSGQRVALDADKGVATATGVVVEGAKTADRGSDHPRTGTIPGTHRIQTLTPRTEAEVSKSKCLDPKRPKLDALRGPCIRCLPRVFLDLQFSQGVQLPSVQVGCLRPWSVRASRLMRDLGPISLVFGPNVDSIFRKLVQARILIL
ncbi:unnamed protein product [Cuscuta campestris]|uniref:Retrotransposon gag domain-containing protein n=1 Tax=Cuscuta campestris TaxID=132261 RepID=A0A484M9W7_9ASTE|nr:unnamed protein product [Cuscuta campestris]